MTTERTNPHMIILGRDSRGLARWQLARKLGIPTRTLAEYESGERPVDDPMRKRLGEALHYPPHFFTIDTGTDQSIYQPAACSHIPPPRLPKQRSNILKFRKQERAKP